MKSIKSLLLISALAIGTLSASALSTSYTFTNGCFTNFPYLNQGGAKLTQILISSTATNGATVSFVDTGTNSLTYTVPAFTNVLTYPTNVSQVFTNYYGVVTTNIYTNALVDLSNYVASVVVTNNMPLRVNIGTNVTSKIDGVNYYFGKGVWLTNNAVYNSGTLGGSATVTITYVQ